MYTGGMHIFALETDIEKLKKSLLSPGEKEIATIRYHGLRLFMRVLGHAFLTLLLVAICIATAYAGVPATLVG